MAWLHLDHRSAEGLSTYGLTHVIPAGSTCVLVLEGEGEVQGESRTADRQPQQVKQHGLSLLYREESSLHTASPPWPPPLGQLVNNADTHARTMPQPHSHMRPETLVPTARTFLKTPKDTHIRTWMLADTDTHTPDTQVT